MKSKVPFLRSAFNYDREAASRESGLLCADPSLTKESFAEECDINTIVRRFHLTGELPTNVRMPTYQDFEGVFDFHSAMNAIASAGEAFDRMPAEVRARFHNNPAEFVDFCSDDKNREEAARLGLVSPKAAVDPLDKGTGQLPLPDGKAVPSGKAGAPSGVLPDTGAPAP